MVFQFSSPEGRSLCSRIIQDKTEQEPHDHQLDVITRVLDRKHVLAVTYTGSGKSGYIYMVIIVLRALASDPSLCPQYKGPQNPVITVICPTNALEDDLEAKMHRYSIPTLVISKERREKMKNEQDKDIFREAKSTSYSVLLMTPEMLASNAFGHLLEDPAFARREAALMVDEAHLMWVWGPGFRAEYTQIGHIHSRFSKGCPLVAFTATLRSGTAEVSPRNAVCRFLGLQAGHFHFVHRSNARYEMKISVRPLHQSRQSDRFPDLDWLLHAKGKILVFCSSIKWGSKIAFYLLGKQSGATMASRPRTYHRLHTDEYNRETLELLRTSSSLLVIATDTLSVGIDIPDIDLVIIIHPTDLDDAVQKGGRAGRDSIAVPSPHLIIYLPNKTYTEASAIIAEAEESPHKRIDTSLPQLALAVCKVANIDEQYENDPDELPCSCSSCRTRPRHPFPSPCTCSGCQPEVVDAPASSAQPATASTQKIPAKKRISVSMREIGRKELEGLRWDIARGIAEDDDAPLIAILSPQTMDRWLDLMQTKLDSETVSALISGEHLRELDKPLEDIHEIQLLIADNRHLRAACTKILSCLAKLHAIFHDIREMARVKRNAQARLRRQTQKAAKEAEIARAATAQVQMELHAIEEQAGIDNVESDDCEEDV
ncbi:P-loop containing nucleoside triphosphate hydrolase protein [Schizophyllum amplum]|uniref:DNA 3'-5' helicase n=1 Tax=Schizophyllum amplum TaxID=97359 RepID=A0A550BS59_9AGAR|nr:P-loop containing nucleoside triphosphate hydrolase protein [Auriculariopsis ampla]